MFKATLYAVSSGRSDSPKRCEVSAMSKAAGVADVARNMAASRYEGLVTNGADKAE